MRKFKSKFLTATLSCVILAGCVGDAPEIECTFTLPTTINVNEEFNLADYIKVSNFSDDYTITFSDSCVSFVEAALDGTTITALDEGKIDFTVNCGSKSFPASVNAISPLRAEFAEDTQDIGYNYSVWEADDDGYVYFSTTHNKQYVFTSQFDQDDNSNAIPGGYFADKNNIVYSFTMTEEDGEEDPRKAYVDPRFQRTGYEPDTLDEVNGEFAISVEGATYYGKNSAYGVLGDGGLLIENDIDDTLGTIFCSHFCYPAAYLEYFQMNYGVSVDSFFIEKVESEDISGYFVTVYVGNGVAIQSFGAYLVTFEATTLGIKALDQLVTQGTTPKGIDISPIVDDISNALDDHNFTIDYSASWYSINSSGTETDLDGNPFVDDLTASIKYYLDFFNADATAHAYVTADQTFVYDSDIEKGFGYVNHQGAAYKYSYKEKTTNGYYADSLGFDSIYSPRVKAENNLTFLEDKEVFDDGTNIWSTLFINEAKSNLNVETFEFNGISALDLIMCLFYTSLPNNAFKYSYESEDYYTCENFDTIDKIAFIISDEYIEGMFDGRMDVTYNGANIAGIKFTFTFSQVNPEDQNTTYEYRLVADVKDIGTTVIPNEATTINY